MKTVWKVLLGLALVVPMGAYVAGSLAASSSDAPAPRPTIIIQEQKATPAAKPSRQPSRIPTPASSPRDTPDDSVVRLDPDDLHDDSDDWGRANELDDDGGHGGSDPGDDGGTQEDHSGPGGGGDDN
jgi:hypothetical protein